MVLGSIPRKVSWLSESVSVCVSVVLMVDRSLSCSPFKMGVGHSWVSGQHSGDVPIEQVWVVHQGLCVKSMVVQGDGSGSSESSSEPSDNKVNNPEVCEPASGIEALNGELSNDEESECASELSSGSVVCEIKVRSVDWSCHSVIESFFGFGEPGSQLSVEKITYELQVSLRFIAPLWEDLFNDVL